MTQHPPRLRDRLRAPLRRCWRAYRRIPWPLRWPLPGLALLFAAVIVVNLLTGDGPGVERSFLIPPGESRSVELLVGAGRNSDVRWEVGERDEDARQFPLRVTLSGPGRELAAAEGSGAFRFKGGFATALYSLELRNDAAEMHAAVVVRWTVR